MAQHYRAGRELAKHFGTMISVTEITRIARNRNGIAWNREDVAGRDQKQKRKIAGIAKGAPDHAIGNRQSMDARGHPIPYQPITAMLFRFRPIPPDSVAIPLRFRAIPAIEYEGVTKVTRRLPWFR
jgi:hypothetical protein